LLLQLLADHRVPAVDLRPGLRSAHRSHEVYFTTDTHWNEYGALVAFDTVMMALGRPQWSVPLSGVRVMRSDRILSGDLADLLGLQGELTETPPVPVLMPPPVPVARDISLGGDPQHPSYLAETGRAGPTVAVIGDSFVPQRILRCC
jgi:alginate O-acetyltransferase complex protein AlgJ